MLSVRNLHVSYGSRAVLRGVGLDVAAGEIVGLVGPNGCGKTTLLRAITCNLPWQAGEVTLRGSPADTLSRRDLARLVAVVPQTPLLPVGYSALDIVLMGRTPHLAFLQQETDADVRKAYNALARVGAGDFAERSVDELSGGERQNVLIARALAQETPLLLLDEPTANLDVGHQVAVFRLARELVETSGLAVLVAIHDLTLASLYCDRLALMAGGAIVLCGPPGDVLTPAALASVYGARVRVLRDDGLPAPVVIPYAGGE